MEGKPYELFAVEPCTPVIGAKVTDVDLRRPSAEVLAELHRALLEWKVLFFEDQHLTTEEHLRLALCWGSVHRVPFYPVTDEGATRFTRGARSGGSENIWHTDSSYLDPVPLGSILRAVEVPDVGGDTLWADMGAAYDNLEDEIRKEIDELTAVHNWVRAWEPVLAPDLVTKLKAELPPMEHPVVTTHPETGRRTLFVSEPYTDHIVGLDPERSSSLLQMLYAQAKVPEFQVRFHWRPGSIAFWDNRAVQHYAVSDYYPQRRVMERVMIAGNGPRSWEISR